MGFAVPWDGAYNILNVLYAMQNIGLKEEDIIVAGRHADSPDPRIEWEVKALSVDLYSNVTIKSTSSSKYIGADSEKVVYNDKAYEWSVSYREVGRWIIQDPASGLLLYLPDNIDGTEVSLTRDGAGEKSYWRFIPSRPASN
ncbi:uncharacterized protein EDB93DRAFT_1336253 [Suillus bovinus]|uniref:uncharacterized protein n=1 Tax=Suillus bovinus TaxID=48563 RepID=UPI001B86C8DA|nr:uncharacterized protein EDB93DRAFT_1336253 [Suillus bovinus]KAG2153750.1 hypothetical protein EDB93DRAFT_1336253 [Suillus bovinus]